MSTQVTEQCDCDRGPVQYWISLTEASGVLVDRIGLCRKCFKEDITRRALSAIGIKE